MSRLRSRSRRRSSLSGTRNSRRNAPRRGGPRNPFLGSGACPRSKTSQRPRPRRTRHYPQRLQHRAARRVQTEVRPARDRRSSRCSWGEHRARSRTAARRSWPGTWTFSNCHDRVAEAFARLALPREHEQRAVRAPRCRGARALRLREWRGKDLLQLRHQAEPVPERSCAIDPCRLRASLSRRLGPTQAAGAMATSRGSAAVAALGRDGVHAR